MENRFALGKPLPPEEQERRRDFQRKLKLRKKKKRSVPVVQKPKLPQFRLSPNKDYGTIVNWTLASFPQKSYAAITQLHKLLAPPTKEKPKLYLWSPKHAKALTDAVNETIRCRRLFRAFYLHYLYKKSRRINNQDEDGCIIDPISLEPISWPVWIVSLKQRAIHEFEQKSLARSWSNNLLQHDGVFSEPRFPTNPLTNLPLNILQVHCAMKVLKRRGNLDWVLSSFASCQYDLNKWKQKFGGALYIEHLEKIFNDEHSYHREEMLMDFAELQFEYHDIIFPRRMFKWIFNSSLVQDYAKLWSKECKQFYVKKYALLDKNGMDDLEVDTSIRCAYLTQIPGIVKQLYYREVENVRRRNLHITTTFGERRIVRAYRRPGPNGDFHYEPPQQQRQQEDSNSKVPEDD